MGRPRIVICSETKNRDRKTQEPALLRRQLQRFAALYRRRVRREKAEIGVFLCFEKPTKPMLKEAAEAGFYRSPDGSEYPRIQILTVEQLLDGSRWSIRCIGGMRRSSALRDTSPKRRQIWNCRWGWREAGAKAPKGLDQVKALTFIGSRHARCSRAGVSEAGNKSLFRSGTPSFCAVCDRACRGHVEGVGSNTLNSEKGLPNAIARKRIPIRSYRTPPIDRRNCSSAAGGQYLQSSCKNTDVYGIAIVVFSTRIWNVCPASLTCLISVSCGSDLTERS